jgi:hypothetical protein
MERTAEIFQMLKIGNECNQMVNGNTTKNFI